MAERAADVLIVGGGPAGCATALTVAEAGFRPMIIDQRRFPRHKTCGGVVSPDGVALLAELGVPADRLAGFHRLDRLMFVADGVERSRRWPSPAGRADADEPAALAARRDLLDLVLLDVARDRGTIVLDDHEAVEPIVERGFVRGAVVRRGDHGAETIELRAPYTVIADGANSRFGRSLGTFRQRRWPYATAIQTVWSSPRSTSTALEVHLDLRHDDGHRLTGYGWVFPLGDGIVNIGVGAVSTTLGFSALNTTHLLEGFAHRIADRWSIDPTSPARPPTSGRIPMGGSVGPLAGPTTLAVGDAAGLANPFTGSGIDMALLSGSMAGSVIVDALRADDPTIIQQYPSRIDDRLGTYYKVGRLLDRIAGRPATMTRLARALVGSSALGAAALEIATGARPTTSTTARIWRALTGASRLAPEA